MTDPAERADSVVWKARVVAVCLALAAIAFRQKPGLVVADTKLDLTANPWGFLDRSLHLWDPQGALGQLQNQAYGYLFPMGPFHAVLISVGLPPWVVQRLWWSLILIVAFLGMWRLSSTLRVGTPWLRIVGGVLYALSPRIASELTVTSVEVWPMAVAPWVLLPLVARGERTWWWRISRSALAFACCGGVNAIASGSALLLPCLWFLTRRPDRRVMAAFLGWLATVTIAMAWWLIPLAVLGRYSPPFLDWIETAGVTTSTASPFEALRGTTAWLGFLTSPTGPQWPGGWLYTTVPMLIVATSFVGALGLVGLTLRRTPERFYLGVALLTGLLCLTAGHTGPFDSPLASSEQHLLDGVLAASRNTHKFDVVLRVPLILCLVSGSAAAIEWARGLGVRAWVAPTAMVSLVLTVAAPSVVANVARSEAYTAIPAYWHAAATWLDAQPDRGSVLVLPASSFADFTWGSTKDDPLQALMQRPMVVRDAVPLGSAGATRFLDAVERELGSGRGSPALTRALAVAGVRFVVVRNDLRLDAQGDPLLAVQAGIQRAGLQRVATFGPLSGNPAESATTTVDYRTLLQRPSVEVYRVPGTSAATATPLGAVPMGLGGPEDLPRLIEATGSPLALLGSDAGAAGYASGGARVLTDGLRRREINFGEPTQNMSHVLTASQTPSESRRVIDFVADPGAPQTTTVWQGITGVSASSSASDPGATLRLGPAFAPAAALDADRGTRWVSGTFGRAVGEWLQVDLDAERIVPDVHLDLSSDSPISARPRIITVSTERGSRQISIAPGEESVSLALPPGTTSWVRATLAGVWPGVPNGFAIAEFRLGGVQPQEVLRVPTVRAADIIVLRKDPVGRSGCLEVDGASYCAPSLALKPDGPPYLARSLTLGRAGSYTMSGTVTARRGASVDELLDSGTGVSARASSRLVDSPIDRPGAAVDGDLGTGWIAGDADLHPRFTVVLPTARTVTGLQFVRGPNLAAAPPEDVILTLSNGRQIRSTVDGEGYVRIAASQIVNVAIQFTSRRPLVNIDSRSGLRTFVPVGFSELRVLGAEDLVRPLGAASQTGAPCGFGPNVTVNGATYPTQVDGPLADLAQDRPLTWRVCGSKRVFLREGANLLTAHENGRFVPESLTLRRTGKAGVESVPLDARRPGPDELFVTMPGRSQSTVVAVGQNYSAGWQATFAGQAVRPVRVNGWMQGWIVPAGGPATLRATFEPGGPYQLGLAIGALLLVALVAAAGLYQRGRLAEPAQAASPSLRWRVGGGVVAFGVLAGVPALVIWVAMWLATVRGREPLRHALRVATLILPCVAAGVVALAPWPQHRANLASPVVEGAITLAVLASVALAWFPSHPVRGSHR